MTDLAARRSLFRRSGRVDGDPSDEPLRRRALKRILLLGTLLVALSVATPIIQQLSPTKSYAVASDSMEPLFSRGSLVVASDEPVETGDIVVYWSPLGEFQVHRIVETVEEDGRTLYRTAGDANGADDSFLVPAADVQGKVVRHAPHVGHLWLLPTWLHHLLFWSALTAYLGVTAWEVRALLRKRLRRVFRFSPFLVVLLWIPSAMAGVATVDPDSVMAADIAPTPLPLAPGASGTSEVSSDRNTATVHVAPPRLWKEIPMWNCKKEAFCTNNISPGDSEEIGSWARIDVSSYTPTPTFYFEAYIAAPAGHSSQVHLYDTTNNVEVPGSRVSTTSTETTLVRSGAFSLSGAKDYTIRSGHSGNGQGGMIAGSRLLLVQDHPTKTAEQVRVSQGTEEASTSWTVPARAAKWRFDGSSTDGITAASFEIVAEVDGDMLTASHIRLVDRSAGTIVSTLRVGILDTRPTRFVSADIKTQLIDGHEYEIEIKRGDGLLSNRLHLYVARVHVLQSGFSTTVRYVDLSWKTATTETGYVVAGHPGWYEMASEWGGRQGHLEATIRNTDAGGSSSAELYDMTNGAPIPGSTTTTNGTAWKRLRSGPVDLGVATAMYALRIRADTGTAEVRQAWLIVHQGPGKTYDPVLAATAGSTACAWAITLHHVASENLARLRAATLSLRLASQHDQVHVQDGILAQASGTPVTTGDLLRAEHIVSTDPKGPGTTTIDTEQRGHCLGSGIRIVQAIRFVLE